MRLPVWRSTRGVGARGFFQTSGFVTRPCKTPGQPYPNIGFVVFSTRPCAHGASCLFRPIVQTSPSHPRRGLRLHRQPETALGRMVKRLTSRTRRRSARTRRWAARAWGARLGQRGSVSGVCPSASQHIRPSASSSQTAAVCCRPDEQLSEWTRWMPLPAVPGQLLHRRAGRGAWSWHGALFRAKMARAPADAGPLPCPEESVPPPSV